MSSQDPKDTSEPKTPAFRVRLPGFVAEQEVGLGDVIKRATGAFGVRPCGGCEKRAQTLNGWIAFRGRRSR